MKLLICDCKRLKGKHARDLEGYFYIAPKVELLSVALETAKPEFILIDDDLPDEKKEDLIRKVRGIKVGFVNLCKGVSKDKEIRWIEKKSERHFYCFQDENKDLKLVHASCACELRVVEKKDHFLFFCPIHKKATKIKVYKDVWGILKKSLIALPVGHKIKKQVDKHVYEHNCIKDMKNEKNIYFDTVVRAIKRNSSVAVFEKKDF